MIQQSEAEYIKLVASEIRKKIKGGNLFGRPIDMNDPDQVLYAAYLAGSARMVSLPITGDRQEE